MALSKPKPKPTDGYLGDPRDAKDGPVPQAVELFLIARFAGYL